MKTFNFRYFDMDVSQEDQPEYCYPAFIFGVLMIVCIVLGVIYDCSNPYVGWIQ